MKTGVECEFFLIAPDGSAPGRSRRSPDEALLRPVRLDASLRRHRRDLRRHARPWLAALPERPRGRQRTVRDELALRRRAGHRRSPRLLQVYGALDRREARPAGDLHAQALRRSHGLGLPRPRVAVARRCQRLRGPGRRTRDLAPGLSFHRRPHPLGRGARRDHQPDGELLQADQRAAHDLGGDLGAQHGVLYRQQPHPHDSHSRRRPLRAAARRRGRQPLPAAGRDPRRRPRWDAQQARPRAASRHQHVYPRAHGWATSRRCR